MSRNLTQDMISETQKSHIRPVVFVYFDIASDPIAFWSGAGVVSGATSPDAAFNALTFLDGKDVIGVSDAIEDNNIGGQLTVSLRADDLDEVSLRQFVRDRREWRGRPALVWLGFLDTESNAIIEWPTRMKTGVMTDVSITRSTATVALDIVIDSDLRNSRVGGYRVINHQTLFPTDTFTAFMVELANKPRGFERQSYTPGSGDGPPVDDRERDADRNRLF